MRGELKRWMFEIKDIGLLPESQMHTRFGDKPPYQAVRDEPSSYEMQPIWEAAVAATSSRVNRAELLKLLTESDDAAVRYWAAVGVNSHTGEGKAFGPADAPMLKKQLDDADAEARLQLAEALAKLGDLDAATPVLIDGMKDENEWVRLRAANIIDRLDRQANDEARRMMQQATNDKNGYVVRVVEKALSDLK
jgi:HEAT repeat protein